MNLAEKLVNELFEIAEKEYLNLIGPKEPDTAQHFDEEVPNRRLCFERLKHQFIDICGEWTCNKCVSGYGCWNRARMDGPDRSSVSFKFDSFCQRKNITAYYLLGGRTRKILENIRKICDAEKPRGKRLPNLNILTYQVCRRLDVEIDESLLKIPKGKIPHDQCKKIFQTLGWEQPSPSRSEARARKKRGCSTRLGPRCDVNAKGA